jgi:hypothetical protein
MNKIFVAILFLAPALAVAGSKPTLNPADYTVAIHVRSSQPVTICKDFVNSTQCWVKEHLNAVIEGKKYELYSEDVLVFALHTGDYKARIIPIDVKRQKVVAGEYEIDREYEFLFPDGKTRSYVVAGESE